MRPWLFLLGCFLFQSVRPCDPDRELCGEVAAEKAAQLRADLYSILNGATQIDVLTVCVTTLFSLLCIVDDIIGDTMTLSIDDHIIHTRYQIVIHHLIAQKAYNESDLIELRDNNGTQILADAANNLNVSTIPELDRLSDDVWRTVLQKSMLYNQ